MVLNPALNKVKSAEKGLNPAKNLSSTVGDNLPLTMSSPIAVILQPMSLKYKTIFGPWMIATAPPAATIK